MNFCVGLTGGIGSGKSTVAALFQKLGVTILDSDMISHQLTQSGGAAISAIRQTFGDDAIAADGAMDRAYMRKLVFSDPTEKFQLESILHPLIREQMRQQISVPSTSPYLLLVVPLLFEKNGFLNLVQKTLIVDCEESTQVARAMQRSGLDEQSVQAIMAAQIPRAERLQRADNIIHNDTDLNSLQEQVNLLHQQYLEICSSAGRK